MKADEIYQILKDRFGEKILEFQGEVIDPFIKVTPDGLLDVAECVRHEPDLYFDALMSLSGIDYGEKLGLVYHLHSMKHLHKVTVKVEVTRDHPRLPTLCFIWRTAEWHEREVYDLFGITFENHPDMRRILLPDDWIGHPLRRDYVTPEFYISKEFPEGIRVPYPDKDPDRGTYIPPRP